MITGTLDAPSEDKAILEEQDVEGVDSSDEDLELAIINLLRIAEKEDEDIRTRLVNIWKRNTFYFNNIQNIFFDSVARDYRTIDTIVGELSKLGISDDVKTVNIYRAFAESIISALSVTPPNVEFLPEDAENPDDVETAEAYSRISEIISEHNHAGLMLIKGLTILFNQGLIAAHNYWKEDPNLGVTRQAKNTKQVEKKIYDVRCSYCGDLVDSLVPEEAISQFQQIECPYCNYKGQSDLHVKLDYEDEVTDWEDTPKGRTEFDIFGPTYVKVSLIARNQSSCGYLVFRMEDNVAKFRAIYNTDEIESDGGDTTLYERWGRIPPEMYGAYTTDIATARYGWFRPWWYWHKDVNEDDRLLLQKKYPNGCKCTVIGEKVLEHSSGSIDEDWTLSFDPRSEFLHAEPAGNAVVPIQDAKNDIFNLGLQSIEYGIPETFANPKTLDFKKYKETRATPGMVTPAKPPSPDKSIGDGFFTLKTATLSNEYIEFDAGLDKLGQFISAAVPSIWGGPQKVGENTATEYTDSKSAALQRLQIGWQIISVFWADLMSKSSRRYADNLREDLRFVKKQNGTYVNIWVQKSSLSGKIGQVKPQVSGQLPQTFEQKKAFIMGLMQLVPNSPQVAGILMHPNNSELLREITGFPDFYVPNEGDRKKQYAEFYEMQKGIQVPIDQDIDNHQVQAEVLKDILVSTIGVYLYKTKPEIYQICVEHYKEHIQASQPPPSQNIPPMGGMPPKPQVPQQPIEHNLNVKVGG